MLIAKKDGNTFVNGAKKVEAIRETHFATGKPVYAFWIDGAKYTIECELCYAST